MSKKNLALLFIGAALLAEEEHLERQKKYLRTHFGRALRNEFDVGPDMIDNFFGFTAAEIVLSIGDAAAEIERKKRSGRWFRYLFTSRGKETDDFYNNQIYLVEIDGIKQFREAANPKFKSNVLVQYNDEQIGMKIAQALQNLRQEI
jgi:hypothetical protein